MNWFQKISQYEVSWTTPIPGTNKMLWQIHLETFIDMYLKTNVDQFSNEDPRKPLNFDFSQSDFGLQEVLQMAFESWKGFVPDELKMGDNLEPRFEQIVKKFIMDKYNFDIDKNNYSSNNSQDEPIPSSEELNNWWR